MLTTALVSFSFFPTLKKCKHSSESCKTDKPLYGLLGYWLAWEIVLTIFNYIRSQAMCASVGESAASSLACCLFLSKLNKSGVYGFPKKKWLNFWLQLNRRNAIISKTYCFMDDTYFLRSICKKKHVYILKPCRKSLAFVWCEVSFSCC